MGEKFFNNAIIGNSNILGCLNNKGELIRLYYPYIDYYQNIDEFRFGFLTNNGVSFFSDGILNKQYYEGNILYTELEQNGVQILQRDYVLPNKNIIIRKLKFDKKSNLIIYSKLNSNPNRKASGMFISNSLIQYAPDFYMATFADRDVSNYQINNTKNLINENGNFEPEDYIGMSDDSALLYSDVLDITVYIVLENELKKSFELMKWCKEQNENLFYNSTKTYWEKYLEKYSSNSILIDLNKIKEKEIIQRTILMYALLSNSKTGAVIASPDVDEEFKRCGRYGYTWPRDGLFINKSLSILKMKQLTDRFYSIWAKKAQLDNGLFEQRYYSNGELAPSWGVQIDETASIIIGIYDTQNYKKHEELIYKATLGLINFINEEYISKPCFDLWEERKGKHLYSTASICYALTLANKMLLDISFFKYKKISSIIEKDTEEIKKSIKEIFVKDGRFVRSTDNKDIDISLLSVCVPFGIVDANDEAMIRTVNLIEEKLKLPNGGYLRYENDNYIGGNAWIISSLWLALYYIEAKNIERANELFDWVTNHADNLNFLPEQIERNGDKTAWISQLSWSHALYVIVKEQLLGVGK